MRTVCAVRIKHIGHSDIILPGAVQSGDFIAFFNKQDHRFCGEVL